MSDPKRGWKYEIDPVFGCWLWAGSIDRHGYGIVWGPGGPRQAHVAVYRALRGDVAPGLRLDHLCRRRRCVRPEHLEPVTEAENQRRRTWRARARVASCAIGHELALHGMVTPEGGRLCRICQGPSSTTRPP